MTANATLPAPDIQRIRHETRRRQLTVARAERITPYMIRLTLTGDLEGFASLGFDDHVKVFIPGDGEPAMRDYTPRHFDRDRLELTLDFAAHEAGPATQWAMNAKAGDTVTVGGPRGSRVISGDIRHWLLIGDETALPAIGRFIEEAAPGTAITAIAAVGGAAEEQRFNTAARLGLHWVHRPAEEAADPARLIDAVRSLTLSEGTFIWIAAEAGVVKALRSHFAELGHALAWMKASGYWVKGEADKTVNFD